MIAMAGMLFSGDKTFMSFAIGTMMVVAVAMIGSLTVLPAMLSWLGDRVEKGRVPFLGRLRGTSGESRVWGAILTASCAGRSSSASRRHGVLLALAAAGAAPAHRAVRARRAAEQSRRRRSRRSTASSDAFPGGATPAVVAIAGDADRIRGAPGGDRRARARRRSPAGRRTGRSASRSRRRATRVRVRSRSSATGPTRRRTGALATLRERRHPGDDRHGRRHRVRRHRRHGGVARLRTRR